MMLSDTQIDGRAFSILPTCVLRWAKARVVIDSINTGRIIFTVIVFTVIDIDFTIFSFKSISTNTPECQGGTKRQKRNKTKQKTPCILKPYGLTIEKTKNKKTKHSSIRELEL